MGDNANPGAAIALRDLGRTTYADALAIQRRVRDGVIAGTEPESLLLTEHEPVVTLGRRGDRGGIRDARALDDAGIEVIETERGGDVTYHGPGQLVAYPILDLRRWGCDLRGYVERLEQVGVGVCAAFGVEAEPDAARHGVYTEQRKIASIGIHVRSWVTMHGIAINVDPDMDHWRLIAPCNLNDVEATSIAAEAGDAPAMDDVKSAFREAFASEFGVVLAPPEPAPR